jgi:hypothetical protein
VVSFFSVDVVVVVVGWMMTVGTMPVPVGSRRPESKPAGI